jgi:hypothetical protein
VLVDGADVGGGGGAVDVPLPVGGHALRVVAPGFLPLESDVVIEDGQVRRVDAKLAPDPRDPRAAELRIAVGCGDPDPRAPADGLDVRVDGERAAGGEAVMGYDLAAQRPVVGFVRLRVTPGKHLVRVAIPECVDSETRVVAAEGAPGVVRGALERSRAPLMLGPSGTPNGWRVEIASLLRISSGTTQFAGENYAVGQALGAIGSAGWVTRWFTALADFGIASGEANRVGAGPPDTRAT